MAGLERLNPDARSAVVKVLAPAEPILFVTVPNAREAARAAWPTAAAGGLLAFLGAPIAFMSIDVVWNAFRYGDLALMPLLLALISLPASLLGIYLLMSPAAAERRARDTVILVTDRRLLTLSIRTGISTQLPARAILGVERSAVERGFGTLQIRHEAIGEHQAETILAGIDDVLEAELAIRRLASDHSMTIIDPVG